MNPYIQDGIERLRNKWPQSHAVQGKHGNCLIVVPSVLLPKNGYVIPINLNAHTEATICTILFIAPPGYPAACPADFFTDIHLRLKSPHHEIPHHVHPPGDGGNAKGIMLERGWDQWADCCQWWKWRLQMWNPNQSNLYQYMRTIQQRLSYAK